MQTKKETNEEMRTGEERVFVPPPTMEQPFSQADVATWELPKIQRNLKVTKKLKTLVETIKTNGGTIPGGAITLATCAEEPGKIFIIDGQHRLWAFKESGVPVGRAKIIMLSLNTKAEMGVEFARLNTSFNKIKTDDNLRALEATHEGLQHLKGRCSFVGYPGDHIRHNTTAPTIHAGTAIRHWLGARPEVPAPQNANFIERFSTKEAAMCADFLNLCYRAWGGSDTTQRLWTAVNIIITAWIYRRVVDENVPVAWHAKEHPTDEEFLGWLMALSADPDYLTWLLNRSVPRDRAECYERVKKIVQARRHAEGKPKIYFPNPDWARGDRGRRRKKAESAENGEK